MASGDSLFNRQTSRNDLRRELRKLSRVFHEYRFTKPNGKNLLFWFSFFLLLGTVLYLLGRQLSDAPPPASSQSTTFEAHLDTLSTTVSTQRIKNEWYFEDAGTLLGALGVVVAFFFPLLIFIAEYVRGSRYGISLINRTAIFPLTIGSIVTALICLFVPEYPKTLALLVGLISLGIIWSAYRFFNWLSRKAEIGADELQELQFLRLFFLLEIAEQSGVKILMKPKVEHLKEVLEVKLERFVTSLLYSDSPEDETYLTEFGRTISSFTNDIDSYNFKVKPFVSTVPSLLFPYIQHLIFGDREGLQLRKGNKSWRDTLLHIPILNSRLAFVVRDADALESSLRPLVFSYGAVFDDTALRDEIAHDTWHQINDFALWRIEPELFAEEVDLIDYQKHVSLSVALFKTYEVLFEAMRKRKDLENFKDVTHAYSRLLSNYLRGGFGARRDIQRDAKNAERELKHIQLDDEKKQKRQLFIEIDKIRNQISIKKWEMMSGQAAVLLMKMQEGDKALEPFLDEVLKILPSDFPDIFNPYLGTDEDNSPSWRWEYHRLQDDGDDADIEGIRTWYGSPMEDSWVPQLTAYRLLSLPLPNLPEEIPDSITITSSNYYRSVTLINLLEKYDERDYWWKSKIADAETKVPRLLSLLRKIEIRGKEISDEELRATRPLENHQEIFAKHVRAKFMDHDKLAGLLVRLGFKATDNTALPYSGTAKAYGITEWINKSTFFHENSLEQYASARGSDIGYGEDEKLLKEIKKAAPKQTCNFEEFLGRLAEIPSGVPAVVIMDGLKLYQLSSLPAFKTAFKHRQELDASEIPSGFAEEFQGVLLSGSAHIPVLQTHIGGLNEEIFVFQGTTPGEIIYHSARPDKSPMSPDDAKLFIDVKVLSENPTLLEEQLSNPKALKDIADPTERRKTLERLARVDIYLRLELDTTPGGIQQYRISGLK